MNWTEGMIQENEVEQLLEKRVPVYSVSNFRELGGFRTKDGRQIKKGLFYRCGALGELNEDDSEYVKKLGIKFVLDLRSAPEAEILNDPQLPGAMQIQLCGMHYPDGSECDFSPAGIVRLNSEAKKAAEAGFDGNYMELLYKEMPFHNKAYQALFKQMQAGRVPLLFHCTAGKDRTGVAAMLIMLALGVDEKTILKDYMLTNICRENEIKAALEERKEEIKKQPEVETYIIHAYGVSLESAKTVLAVIHEKYPKIEDYFLAEYHLDKAELERLKDQYLE